MGLTVWFAIPPGSSIKPVRCGPFYGVQTMNLIKTFVRNEDGAAAAEYALILAVIGAGIYLAADTLGTAIAAVINAAAGVISGITFT